MQPSNFRSTFGNANVHAKHKFLSTTFFANLSTYLHIYRLGLHLSNNCIIKPSKYYNPYHYNVPRPFGRLVYWCGCPNTGTPKNTFKVFFYQLYFNKKCSEVALINDFTIYLIISKWLRRQKFT